MLIFIFILLIGFSLGWILAIHLLTKDIELLNQEIAKQEDLIETLCGEIDWFFHRSRQ